MADLSNYLNALRSALQMGGLVSPAEQAERIFNYFRGPGSSTAPAAAPARPAPTETGAVPAPAPAPTAPAPRRPMAPAPASSSEPMPLPPEPAAAGQPQSLLDRLRQSTAASFENPGLQSAGDIGAGMLASRSPNFFSMLGAGLQAQRSAERERTQDLTAAARAETEEQYRRDQIAARREQFNDPLSRALLQARIDELQGRGARGAGSRLGLSAAQIEAARSRFTQEATRLYPNPTPGMPDPQSQQEERRANREAYIQRQMQELYDRESQRLAGERPSPPPPAPTPQQNVPTITPTGRPTR